MTNVSGRIDDGKHVVLCEHVGVNLIESIETFPGCEYAEDLIIRCTVCKTEHVVTIYIN